MVKVIFIHISNIGYHIYMYRSKNNINIFFFSKIDTRIFTYNVITCFIQFSRMFIDSDVPYTYHDFPLKRWACTASPDELQASELEPTRLRRHVNSCALNSHCPDGQEFAPGDLMLKIAHVDPIVDWLPPLPPIHTGEE